MRSDKLSLTAIILAGGQSSRMGRDKALIAIDGVPLLHRVSAIALECTPQVYVVTPWIERYESMLPAGCQLIQEHSIQEHSIQESLPQNHPILRGGSRPGPLVGFAQGLAQVRTEWALLLACDLPGLQSGFLQAGMADLAQAEGAIAVLPKTEKGWDPLCGFYRTSCLSSLNAAIERGERSFQRWLSQENVKELAVGDTTILFNCNTPADLQRYTSTGGI